MSEEGNDTWHCCHSGWLHVRARIHRTWKRRFVVLTEERLSFYKSDQPGNLKSGGIGVANFICGVGGLGIPFQSTRHLKIVQCAVNVDPVITNHTDGGASMVSPAVAIAAPQSAVVAQASMVATATGESRVVPAAKRNRSWSSIWHKAGPVEEQVISGVLFTVVPSNGRFWEFLAASKNDAYKWKSSIDKQVVLVGLKQQSVPCHNLGKRVKTTPAQDGDSSDLGRNRLGTGGGKAAAGVGGITLSDADLQVLGVDVNKLNKEGDGGGKIAEGNGGCRIVGGEGDQTVAPLWPDLKTSKGCIDFLKSNCLNIPALRRTLKLLDAFNRAYDMGDATIPVEVRLHAWKGTIRSIVRSFVEHLLQCNPMLGTCLRYPPHMDQLQMAAETWVLSCIHDKIIGNIAPMYACKERELQKILAKLDQIDPTRLGVREEHKEAILGEAVQAFRRLNHVRTPMEKVICLQQTMKQIVEGIQSIIRARKGKKEDELLLPNTDDLVSLLIVLMTKAKVSDLLANGCFIDEFWELNKPGGHSGELGYHLINFRAACEHLQSEETLSLCASVPEPLPMKVNPADGLENAVNGLLRGSSNGSNFVPVMQVSESAAAHCQATEPDCDSSIRKFCGLSNSGTNRGWTDAVLVAMGAGRGWIQEMKNGERSHVPVAIPVCGTAASQVPGVNGQVVGVPNSFAGTGNGDRLSGKITYGSFERRVGELLTAPGLTANTGRGLGVKGIAAASTVKGVAAPGLQLMEALSLAQIGEYLGFKSGSETGMATVSRSAQRPATSPGVCVHGGV